MPHTTQCPQCGVRLNVPEAGVGRRLKCPKCGTKFLPDAPNPNANPNPNSASSAGRSAIADASLATMLDVTPIGSHPDLPAPPARPPSGGHGQVDMPTSSGDLRETFDLPLLVDDTPTAPRGREVGDAEALFQDRPTAKRRQSAAEARAHARRCPTCGGVVPAGMSLCNSCGLNLETGQRVDLDEDLAPAPVIRAAGAPIGVWIIGGISFLGSILLATMTLIQASRADERNGFLLLALVCAFGIYASVQFLRGKSVKLMLIALSLGVLINFVAMIALPIYIAYSEPPVITNDDLDDIDGTGIVIPPVTDRLDTQRLTLGILGLVVYAAVSVYLTSPRVRRHFAHRDLPR